MMTIAVTENERRQTMSKYVNRDDVVVAFGQSLNNMLSRDDGEQIAMSLIKGIPTIEVPQWIPCSERLPNEDGEYLTTWGVGIMGDGEGVIDVLYYGIPLMPARDVEDKCFYESTEYADVPYDDVIAWMPLPKPYEETDHE